MSGHDTYSVADAALMLGCSKHTVHRLIRGGLLTATKEPGRTGSLHVDAESVRSVLAGRAESLTTAETANRIGTSLRSVQRYVAAGRLRLHRISPRGRHKRIALGSVQELHAEMDARRDSADDE
jgi:excisionase family DNA binding protein